METIRSLVKSLISIKGEAKANQLEGEDLLSSLKEEGKVLCQLQEHLDKLLDAKLRN